MWKMLLGFIIFFISSCFLYCSIAVIADVLCVKKVGLNEGETEADIKAVNIRRCVSHVNMRWDKNNLKMDFYLT